MSDTNSNDERGLKAVVPEVEPIEVGRSLIVVIGINDYVHHNKLKNAVQDAIGLQQVMIDKLGFSAPIPPLLNTAATKDAIYALVEDQLYKVVEENDNLIFFFAGHGTTRVSKVGDGEIETGYLVPVEATDSWSEHLEIDSLLKTISKLPARHILVILDSCESGIALGETMQRFRDTNRYANDLNRKISRKIITSAQRDQLAKDSGPVPGHSLFTGTLINGFNWGKADLDGNGLISSSELGLFIQQQVAQASISQQTPDFGSFHLDDRGEMVISLRNPSFDALKARAFSALHNGELTIFKTLALQLISLRPLSFEALYIKYRLEFLAGNFDEAIKVIDQLLSRGVSTGLIPLFMDDIWKIKHQFNWWKPILEIPITEIPIEVSMIAGYKQQELQKIMPKKLGELIAFPLEYGKTFQLTIKNLTDKPIHLYMLQIDEDGRFEPVTLWYEEDVLLHGLPPDKEMKSYPFLQYGSAGMCEIRLFLSPKRLRFFLFPPAAKTRGTSFFGIEQIEPNDLQQIKSKSFYYNMTNKLSSGSEE
jgi:Caspase domain